MPVLPRANAGELDRLITIEQPTHAPDDSGDVQPTWATVKQVWSKRTVLTGREAMEGQAAFGMVDAKYEIREDTDLVAMDASWRIVDAGVTAEIVAVLDSDGVGQPITVMARMRR